MHYPGHPQRVRCRHCGKYQIENFTRRGRIYVLGIGGQLSRGPRVGPKRERAEKEPFKQGQDIIKAYVKKIKESFS